MKDLIARALVELAPALLTAFTGGLTWALAMLGNYLRAKAANSKVSGVLVQVDEIVMAIVQDIEGTLKAELERARLDGIITPEEGRGLREAALNRLKASLGVRGLELLSRVMGLAGASLDTFLSGKLEGAVAAVSAQRTMAELSAPPLPMPH